VKKKTKEYTAETLEDRCPKCGHMLTRARGFSGKVCVACGLEYLDAMEKFRKLAEAGGEGPGRMFVATPSVVDVELAEAQEVAEAQYERLRTEAPDLVTMVVEERMTLAAAAAELTKRNAALPGNVPIETAAPIPKPARWKFPRRKGAVKFAREAVDRYRTEIDKGIMNREEAIRKHLDETTDCPKDQLGEMARYAARELSRANSKGKPPKKGGSTPVSPQSIERSSLKTL
jgi:hypothetical protein